MKLRKSGEGGTCPRQCCGGVCASTSTSALRIYLSCWRGSVRENAIREVEVKFKDYWAAHSHHLSQYRHVRRTNRQCAPSNQAFPAEYLARGRHLDRRARLRPYLLHVEF